MVLTMVDPAMPKVKSGLIQGRSQMNGVMGAGVIAMIGTGIAAGVFVGVDVGDTVGDAVGLAVGDTEGLAVGDTVGLAVVRAGLSVGVVSVAATTIVKSLIW